MNKRKAYRPLRRVEADSNDLSADTDQGAGDVEVEQGDAASRTGGGVDQGAGEVEVEQGGAATGGGVSGLLVDGVEGELESGSPDAFSLGSAGPIASSLARDVALVDAAAKESGGEDARDGVESGEDRKSVDLLEAYFIHMDKKYEQWVREAEGGGREDEEDRVEDWVEGVEDEEEDCGFEL